MVFVMCPSAVNCVILMHSNINNTDGSNMVSNKTSNFSINSWTHRWIGNKTGNKYIHVFWTCNHSSNDALINCNSLSFINLLFWRCLCALQLKLDLCPFNGHIITGLPQWCQTVTEYCKSETHLILNISETPPYVSENRLIAAHTFDDSFSIYQTRHFWCPIRLTALKSTRYGLPQTTKWSAIVYCTDQTK